MRPQSKPLDLDDDQDIYLKVEEEFNSDKRQEALWIKSLTLCEGDEQKAKYKYIELRVEEEKDIKVVRRYEGTIVKAASVRQHFNIDEKASYILRLEQAGINAKNIYIFLDDNTDARGIYNKAGGGSPGLIALSNSNIIYKKYLKKDADERLPFIEAYKKGKKAKKESEGKKAKKESENDPFPPDHWVRKVFLVVYPVMFVSGFIEVLTEGVKDPLRFTFNAISDGGISTIAFVAFIIGVIWTYMIYQDKGSSK